ncbi:MAG: 16S rRNA (guanine(966)-N(2))-methyltransferase RsmD [Chloroflexi bacterium]|nr:16S rRNA (guanine(966)-N(2))-methyltransferase RsmD [Chloroflexota bacterium]
MSVRITGGEHRGRRLRSYKGSDLRPTSDRVRGAIFSILGPDALEGARVLDLYSGTGALGIEALSRGAAWVDFVEADARRCQQIRESLRELSLENHGKVYSSKVENILDSLPEAYELIFADPPYDTAPWANLMDGLSKHSLLKQNSVVVAEHRYGTAMAERYDGLAQVSSRRYGDTSVSFYKFGDTN